MAGVILFLIMHGICLDHVLSDVFSCKRRNLQTEPNRHPFFSYKNVTDKEESSGPNRRIVNRRAQ